MSLAEPTTEGTYGDRVVAVEPGGNEHIAEADRHGRPSQLFWTWTSPNLEFATIFVGMLAVLAFGMTFWQAVAGIMVGTGLGAVAHFLLSARGPLHGVPQMVMARLAFGFRGNAVPAVLMSITAGVGWFATNSVSGAFALSTLFGFAPLVGLVIIVAAQTVLAFFGHNLVQAFERFSFPVLAVIFLAASLAVFAHADLGNAAPAADGVGGLGGFLLTAESEPQLQQIELLQDHALMGGRRPLGVVVHLGISGRLMKSPQGFSDLGQRPLLHAGPGKISLHQIGVILHRQADQPAQGSGIHTFRCGVEGHHLPRLALIEIGFPFGLAQSFDLGMNDLLGESITLHIATDQQAIAFLEMPGDGLPPAKPLEIQRRTLIPHHGLEDPPRAPTPGSGDEIHQQHIRNEGRPMTHLDFVEIGKSTAILVAGRKMEEKVSNTLQPSCRELLFTLGPHSGEDRGPASKPSPGSLGFSQRSDSTQGLLDPLHTLRT